MIKELLESTVQGHHLKMYSGFTTTTARLKGLAEMKDML